MALRQLFDESVLEAETWTHRSTVPFEIGRVVPEKRRAYKLGTVADYYVERDDLESGARRLIESVKSGVISRLVAGTGTGKSTKMPMLVSCDGNSVGIVLCPTAVMAKSVSHFVARTLVVGRTARCSVAYVDNYSLFKSLVKPAVAYMGVSEFLTMLAAHIDLFERHVVGYVYVDESHERIPAYVVLRFLMSVDVFKRTRVFLGSATASDQNMETRAGNIKHVVKGYKPEDMMYDSPYDLSGKSPLHHSMITQRTQIFVPNTTHFEPLKRYYEDNAVKVMTVDPCASSGQLKRNDDLLADTVVAIVVLDTPAHQSCYTPCVDKTIDCGVTTYLAVDVDGTSITKHDRIVTEFERVQRCGRTGRFMSGSACYVEGEPADDNFELYSGSEIYVALWCKVFAIEVTLDYLKPWTDLVDGVSVKCAQVLLCSRVHPALLINFLDSNGKSYSGIRHLFKKMLGDTEVVESSGMVMPATCLEAWLPKRLPEQYSHLYDGEFYSPCELPNEWLPIVCALYHGLTGNSVTTLFTEGTKRVKPSRAHVDNHSVISFALSASSVGSLSEVSVSNSRALHGLRLDRDAELTPADSVSMVGDRKLNGGLTLPSYHSNARDSEKELLVRKKAVSAKQSRIESVSTRPKESSRITSYVDDVTRLRSARDQDIVSTVKFGLEEQRAKKVVVRGTVSDVSDVRSSVEIVKVKKRKSLKAKDLVAQRIRPYTEDLQARFLSLRVDERQRRYYQRLKACSIEIATLHKTDMDAYFLATMLTWNRTVSNYSQFRAAPYTGLLATVRNDRMVAEFKSDMSVCRGFLETFEHHGYKLAVHDSIDQAGKLRSTEQLVAAISAATCALQLASDAARAAHASVVHCVKVHRMSHGRVGHYYIDGDVMYIVQHVFSSFSELGLTINFPRYDVKSFVVKDDSRLYRCKLSSPAESMMAYRSPRVSEPVVLIAYLDRLHPDTFGVYSIVSVGSVCTYDADVCGGMSGAPIMSLVDGAIVGFHHGVIVDEDQVRVSEFVPVA